MIKGIQITPSQFITHFFFVDDVILFVLGNMEEWSAYKEALDLFCSATGMKISNEKSSLLFNEVDEDIRSKILTLLPYNMEPINTGFKYLGYHLKPLGYWSNDWKFLISMYENRIKNWTYIFLSLGGRFVLIRSVLTGLGVYWFALAPHIYPKFYKTGYFYFSLG